MALIRWELDRLRGLSPYAQMMYLLVYRQGVDEETGLFAKRMNKQAWWEVLSFVPCAGSAADWNTQLPDYTDDAGWRGWLRNRKAELVRAGLLLKSGQYDFILCVFAEEGLIRPKQQRTQSAHNNARNNDDKLLINKDTHQAQRMQENTSSALPSYISTTTNAPENKLFGMSVDWQPTAEFKKSALRVGGFSVGKGEAHHEQALFSIADVQAFWTRPDRLQTLKTQAQWELEVIRTMQRQQQRAASNVVPFKPAPQQARALVVPNLRMPELVRWAASHNIRLPAPGEEDHQYLAYLRNHCERLNIKREGASVRAASQGVKV